MSSAGMNKQRKIVLLNASKIMREMLTRAIENQSNLIIDREILVNADLDEATEGGMPLDADWLITMETGDLISQAVLDAAETNPRTRLLVLATDGSQVMLRWFEEKTRLVDKLDLPVLMEILKGEAE